MLIYIIVQLDEYNIPKRVTFGGGSSTASGVRGFERLQSAKRSLSQIKRRLRTHQKSNDDGDEIRLDILEVDLESGNTDYLNIESRSDC